MHVPISKSKSALDDIGLKVDDLTFILRVKESSRFYASTSTHSARRVRPRWPSARLVFSPRTRIGPWCCGGHGGVPVGRPTACQDY
jgi:hypothetical protein